MQPFTVCKIFPHTFSSYFFLIAPLWRYSGGGIDWYLHFANEETEAYPKEAVWWGQPMLCFLLAQEKQNWMGVSFYHHGIDSVQEAVPVLSFSLIHSCLPWSTEHPLVAIQTIHSHTLVLWVAEVTLSTTGTCTPPHTHTSHHLPIQL